MQELINRTNGIAGNLFRSALDAAYLASYLGLSYIALSVATSFVAKMMPSASAGTRR